MDNVFRVLGVGTAVLHENEPAADQAAARAAIAAIIMAGLNSRHIGSLVFLSRTGVPDLDFRKLGERLEIGNSLSPDFHVLSEGNGFIDEIERISDLVSARRESIHLVLDADLRQGKLFAMHAALIERAAPEDGCRILERDSWPRNSDPFTVLSSILACRETVPDEIAKTEIVEPEFEGSPLPLSPLSRLFQMVCRASRSDTRNIREYAALIAPHDDQTLYLIVEF